MDDQYIIVKTLRVAATSGQPGAGHPNLLVATRLNAILQQHPVEVFFAPVSAATVRATATTVVPDLPPNVHLQTFRTSLRSDSSHNLPRCSHATFSLSLAHARRDAAPIYAAVRSHRASVTRQCRLLRRTNSICLCDFST
jgi:hypothetical protein